MKRKKQRQDEAKARQAERDKRTSRQQLARLNKAGWRAKKERARLTAEPAN